MCLGEAGCTQNTQIHLSCASMHSRHKAILGQKGVESHVIAGYCEDSQSSRSCSRPSPASMQATHKPGILGARCEFMN